MKRWDKPEIVDLDFKFTCTNGVPIMSGGFDITDCCNLCGHPITDSSNFHANRNHTGKCPHSKHNKYICPY